MVNLPKILQKEMENKAVYFTENEELVKAIDDSLSGFPECYPMLINFIF